MSQQRMPLVRATAAGDLATPTVAQALRDGAERLQGIADNPRLEARLLLGHALGLSQNDLIREPGRQIECTIFENLLARRIAREPLALIVGHREFWSLELLVSPATLIPRPDSETLVEAALAVFANRAPPRRILDLGTGTGCLLLALLTEFSTAFGIGLDVVPDAAALAKANAIRLNLANRSGFLVSDWTDSLIGRFDLIVANPPYIRHSEIQSLMADVARYEPHTALDGGLDGYDAYRIIVPNLRRYLEPDGVAVLELGCGQATYVTEQARAAGFDASLRLDFAQISRAIVLTLPNR
jgi:release factor glutamine methyltransferase